MNFVERLLERLFKSDPSGKNTSGNNSIKSEQINRTASFMQEYKEWLDSGNFKMALNEILNQYIMYENGEEGNLLLMNGDSANGFILYGINEPAVFYMMDYLKDTIRDSGYTLFNADRNVYQQPDHFKVVERYFLKPKLSGDDFHGLRKQIYGNILIEVELKDDTPKYLKLLSTTYQDHKYEKAFSFDELFKYLFTYRTNN